MHIKITENLRDKKKKRWLTNLGNYNPTIYQQKVTKLNTDYCN